MSAPHMSPRAMREGEARVTNRKHWLIMDAARHIVGCHCGFPAALDDCGFGDSVVDHIYRVGLVDGRAL